MHKFRQVGRKFLTFVALLSMVTQSMSPYLYVLPRVANAQEATVTPTDTPTPTDTIAPTPTDTPTPVPSETPIETPTSTDDPTATVTSVPTDSLTVAPTEQVNNNSPPTDNNSNQDSTPIEAPTIEVSPTSSPSKARENESLSVVVLENTAAPSIDLDSYETQGSASLVTDKPDYAPTDTVVISGTDFNSGEIYTLIITSKDEPSVHFETQVTADENGSFVYAYQLDGKYRPNYKVAARDSGGNIIATITFTDTQSCVAPPSGMTSWWPGDGNANDIAGTNNGTPENGATFASGKVDQAFSFDGTNDRVAASNVGDFGSSPFTVDFWMNSNDDGPGTYIIGKSHANSGLGWDLRLNSNTIQVVGVNGWPAQYNFASDASVTSGVWHHIALTSTETEVNLYIDGVLKGTSPRSAISYTSNPFRIGWTTDFGGSAFNGLIDEVEIFNRALSQDEINTIYNADSAGKCKEDSTPTGTITIEKVVEGGDVPSSNWYFNILDDQAQTVASDKHDGDSVELPVGTYTISESTINGYVLTGATGVCSDFDGQNATLTVTEEGGTCTLTNTLDPVSVLGFKYFDVDQNGSYDNDDYPLEGWTLCLNPDGNNQGYPVSPSECQSTDVNGFVEWTVPTGPAYDSEGFGAYHGLYLREINQDGWTQTFPPNGGFNVDISFNERGEVLYRYYDGEQSQYVTTPQFGNWQAPAGSVKVNKLIDADGDGEFEGDNDVANDLGFRWGLDSEDPSRTMGETADQIPTGDYSVNENDIDGYHFVGWFYTNDEFGSCEETTDDSGNELGSQGTDLPAEISVSSNEQTDITLCNARDKGTITVDKVTNPEEDSTIFDINLRDGETTVHTSSLSDTDNPDTYQVPSGTYELSEQTVPGWDLTNVDCSKNKEESIDPSEIVVEDGDDIYCTFTNTKRGKIIVTKYNDLDGNGELDKGEGVLSGWTINLGQDSTDTGDNGQVVFDGLLPDTYSLSEDIKPGWEQTNIFCDRESFNEGEVRVGAGQTVNCSILNKSTTPILTITKENNTGGATLTPGSEVLYTITVNLSEEGGAANDVNVTDLLPDGFKYKGGSWTASSNVNPSLVVSEPVYASPGIWNLGDMTPGETITLTLIATISNDQQLGLYKDIAWAVGKSIGGEDKFAIANDPGDLDSSESNFVGTEVNVGKSTTESVGLEVKRGEVLGASTELPATGAKTLWTLVAVALFLAGLNLVVIGSIIRKRYV